MLGDPNKNPGQPDEPKKPSSDKDKPETEEVISSRAFVKSWQDKIKKAKEKFNDDFERMRENMDFVYGLQWPGQSKLSFKKYVINRTLRLINQRVATLYARNPQVEVKHRQRRDFQIWDGNMESIFQAIIASSQAQMMGMPVPPQMMAMMMDYQQGKQRQKMLDGIGDTLKKIYQYQQETQEPNFKVQMKQLVRRATVCGVGYIKVSFCREYESELTHSETRMSLVDRMQIAKGLLQKMADGKMEPSDAEVQTLRNLVASFNVAPLDSETISVQERLIFDFPQATAIIPDDSTRMLRGFVGSHWVVEEMRYSLEFVNSFFDKKIDANTDITLVAPDGKPIVTPQDRSKQDSKKAKITLWLVSDLDSKTEFIIADGYKDFVEEPAPVTPAVRGFWNIVPVLFNDVEVTDDCKGSIFPPSDVDLLRHPQTEWNRVRNSLKRHRIANRPRWMTPHGTLKDEDLDQIAEADEQQFIELKGLPPGADPAKVLQPVPTVQITPELYDTDPLQEDTLIASGQQEANIGPAQPNVTATVGTIAEQSRQSVASSDTDGLDDSLTQVAQIGGEMLFREMSSDIARKIAGIGAVWTDEPQAKEELINQISLVIKAASSGRPNKAVEIANWERLVPFIMQAAQMPPNMQPTIQAVIRETIKRLDDGLDPSDFFPLPMPMVPPQEGAQQAEPPSNTRQGRGSNAPARSGQPGQRPKRAPLQQVQSGVAVPLAGAQ